MWSVALSTRSLLSTLVLLMIRCSIYPHNTDVWFFLVEPVAQDKVNSFLYMFYTDVWLDLTEIVV